MFVTAVRHQRARPKVGRSADVQGLALHDAVHDRAHEVGPADQTRAKTKGSERLLLPAVVVLLLSVPALTYVGYESGLPRRLVLLMAAAWSLVQLPLIMLVVHRLLEGRSQEADLIYLGARAASAEASLRRDQERLHELRSTVSGIGTTYRLLRDRREGISGPTRTMLESLCETEMARLQRLLAETTPGAPQILDISTVVDPLVAGLRFRGNRVARVGTRPLAMGRPDDVAEIINILLENAVRHAPGSPIVVRVENGPALVTVSVVDQGPGVDAELASQIFERGVRAPESPGQGIGLHVARRLAREMGGDVRLTSCQVRGGATFTLSLPSADGMAR
jgi:signal transduction histidine kinase